MVSMLFKKIKAKDFKKENTRHDVYAGKQAIIIMPVVYPPQTDTPPSPAPAAPPPSRIIITILITTLAYQSYPFHLNHQSTMMTNLFSECLKAPQTANQCISGGNYVAIFTPLGPFLLELVQTDDEQTLGLFATTKR